MNKEINIRLMDKFAEINFRADDNSLVNKIVDIADLHAIFKDNVNHDTGELAVFGDGAIGIRRIISRGNKSWIIVNAINPCVDANFLGTKYENVFFPSLIMAVHLTKNGQKYTVSQNKTFVQACEHTLAGDKSQMYKFPFSNVWDGIGRICWGGIYLPKLDSPGQAIGVLQMFLYGDMNNDLYANGHLQTPKDSPYKEAIKSPERLLKALSKDHEKLTCFPYDEITLSKKMKYSELISHCENNI